MEIARSDVTELLYRWRTGDIDALDSLIPLVYEDLRRLANYYLLREAHAQTLQSTAVVHEVYLRLSRHDDPRWESRAHFFAVAAKMIRRVLVDHARRKFADKRGGRIPTAQLDEALSVTVWRDTDLIELDESLKELAEFDARKCQVVEMRFFAGLSARDIASVLGTTEGAVRRDWTIARAWLYRRLRGVSAP